MNDEIKVGSYIRTDDGYIAKVIEIFEKCNEDTVIIGDGYINSSISNLIYNNCCYIKDIIKHSPNLIKLLQVGDYVNGHLVVDIRNDEDKIEIGIESDNMINKYLKEKDIKTICTKEQFEKIMYKVGE